MIARRVADLIPVDSPDMFFYQRCIGIVVFPCLVVKYRSDHKFFIQDHIITISTEQQYRSGEYTDRNEISLSCFQRFGNLHKYAAGGNGWNQDKFEPVIGINDGVVHDEIIFNQRRSDYNQGQGQETVPDFTCSREEKKK